MAKTRPAKRRPAVTLKRKNMLIDQDKLDAAKAALGAATETAAVDGALDLVVFRAEVFNALDHLASIDAFGPLNPTRRAG